MKLVYISLSVMMAVLTADAAWAKCEETLILEQIKLVKSIDEKLALANIVNEGNYEEAKQHFGNAAGIDYDGIPLRSNNTYDDFKKWAHSLMTQYNYNYDRKVSIDYLSSRLPDSSVAAYRACINQPGVSAWITNSDLNVATLHVQYNGGVGAVANLENAFFSGTRTSNKILRKVWLSGEHQVYPLERKPGEDLVVQINIGHYGDEAHAPLPPKIQEPKAPEDPFVGTYYLNGSPKIEEQVVKDASGNYIFRNDHASAVLGEITGGSQVRVHGWPVEGFIGHEYIYWNNFTLWSKKVFSVDEVADMILGDWSYNGQRAMKIMKVGNNIIAENEKGERSVMVNGGVPLVWTAVNWGPESAIFSPDGKTIFWGLGEHWYR
jgi:hypothetical protein